MQKRLQSWWYSPKYKLTAWTMFWEGATIGFFLAWLYFAAVVVPALEHIFAESRSVYGLIDVPTILFCYLMVGTVPATGFALIGGITAVLQFAFFRKWGQRINRQAAHWVGGGIAVLICYALYNFLNLGSLFDDVEDVRYTIFGMAVPFTIYTLCAAFFAGRVHRLLTRAMGSGARP